MPQRDYAARSNKKKGTNKSLILGIIILLLLAGGIGLWVLKENAPTQAIPVAQPTQPVQQPQGPALPSRPEEVYSYIRDLETREVLTDNSQKSQEKLAQLSAEQKQQLEAKLKQEEAARLAAEKPAQPEASATPASSSIETVTEAQPTVVALTPEELAAKKAAEQQKAAKLAEEKRKQAELKKQQELAKQNQVPVETAKPVETAASAEQQAKLAAEKAKAKKAEQTKVVASAAKPADKATNQAGRFGLQCGAFKNKAQAENMQARLAMAGFNARISSSSDWNRVFVGPVGDRAAASTAQSNARSVAECVIVSM
ncbi:SPOR domain-containing protein [Actinobacillus equuli]|uniref:SPOR domain-containing protein n=1 Tax=Actinobacillus equuli TaxID=718 RepID=UPI002443129C|nr:SPOR domain-containing protein [Actinobacillus equuli]WGE46021.1 SPOR domain-containing protein [Actinobacillus equuli subsp. haemolyticus]